MKILIIGASGTIGTKLTPYLRGKHEIITAGRYSGERRVDISSPDSIKEMFETLPKVDACICIAASGPTDNFATLTEDQILNDSKGKLFGQINTVLIGQHYLNEGGCFTLTSGIFADRPYKGVTGGAIISGALHSFVLSASIELPHQLRINVVSPGLVEDSAAEYAHLFPGMVPVTMERIITAYEATLNQQFTGNIIKVY